MIINIRFFIIDYDAELIDVKECTELEFLEADGEIEYERHTMFENGVDQVCLTKK